MEGYYMKKRYFHILLAMVIFCLAAGGCGRKHAAQADKKLVAKINNYGLTVDDFRDEARAVFANQYLAGDPEKMKEDLLDEIVVKKILIQEAEAENFDKDRAFMKEIEKYWEQALLKLLIKKKMQEFLQQTRVSEEEVRKEYEKRKGENAAGIGSFEEVAPEIRSDIRRRKVQEDFQNWITGLKKKAHVRIYKENLKYINLK
jgi:hypothetical protein